MAELRSIEERYSAFGAPSVITMARP
jgi:hypothetical protein